jgi:hypothetical protein
MILLIMKGSFPKSVALIPRRVIRPFEPSAEKRPAKFFLLQYIFNSDKRKDAIFNHLVKNEEFPNFLWQFSFCGNSEKTLRLKKTLFS